ncbi:ankyrin [Neoconidiobolus thromboides FSU 785]|nr:ankyrin [Neoconidiobolus thromboides FSU 785]
MGNYKYSKNYKKKDYNDTVASIYMKSLESGLLPEQGLYYPEQTEENNSMVLTVSRNSRMHMSYGGLAKRLIINKRWSGMNRNPFKIHRENELIRLAQISKGNTKVNEQLLFSAANSGNVTLVRRLLNGWVNPSCRDDCNRTPLHFAASKGFSHIIELLIEAGADATLMDKNGNSPLDLAAISNHLEAVVRLTEAGAKVSDGEMDTSSSQSSKLNHISNPLRMIKARLSAYKSINLPMNEALIKAMDQIIKILRSHMIQYKKQVVVDNSVDIEDLCNQLETNLNLKNKESIKTSSESNESEPLPVDNTLDQINLLMEKLNIT